MENQLHFRRPSADAAHGYQPLHDGLVIESPDVTIRWHGAVKRFCREIFERCDFCARKAGALHDAPMSGKDVGRAGEPRPGKAATSRLRMLWAALSWSC